MNPKNFTSNIKKYIFEYRQAIITHTRLIIVCNVPTYRAVKGAPRGSSKARSLLFPPKEVWPERRSQRVAVTRLGQETVF